MKLYGDLGLNVQDLDEATTIVFPYYCGMKQYVVYNNYIGQIN